MQCSQPFRVLVLTCVFGLAGVFNRVWILWNNHNNNNNGNRNFNFHFEWRMNFGIKSKHLLHDTDVGYTDRWWWRRRRRWCKQNGIETKRNEWERRRHAKSMKENRRSGGEQANANWMRGEEVWARFNAGSQSGQFSLFSRPLHSMRSSSTVIELRLAKLSTFRPVIYEGWLYLVSIRFDSGPFFIFRMLVGVSVGQFR